MTIPNLEEKIADYRERKKEVGPERLELESLITEITEQTLDARKIDSYIWVVTYPKQDATAKIGEVSGVYRNLEDAGATLLLLWDTYLSMRGWIDDIVHEYDGEIEEFFKVFLDREVTFRSSEERGAILTGKGMKGEIGRLEKYEQIKLLREIGVGPDVKGYIPL